MTRTRYRFHEATYPYFVTCTIVDWIALFSYRPAATLVLQSLEYLHKRKELILHGYVIMENHLHLLISSEDPTRHLRRFKSYTARRIIDLLEEHDKRDYLQRLAAYKADYKRQRYQFWQEGSHPKQVRDPAMLRQKLEYIHNNPVKRGYVDSPEEWRYSSARNYLGRRGLLPIERLE